ncbi:hypothetical protein CARUB_v10002322mg [Capsella rubella]|uniref:Uncharacterized protein n=1 Tax=Capsella rubella TaxID=81985 RepID=R0HA36_9BRAS|nr:hypothetical protein CARUB_v10002322mg [Capsella rubella]
MDEAFSFICFKTTNRIFSLIHVVISGYVILLRRTDSNSSGFASPCVLLISLRVASSSYRRFDYESETSPFRSNGRDEHKSCSIELSKSYSKAENFLNFIHLH